MPPEWGYWIAGSTATTNNCNADLIWGAWTTTASTSITYVTDTTWGGWANSTNARPQRIVLPPAKPLTKRELAKAATRQRRAIVQRRRDEREREAAKRRAERLLVSVLTPEQRRERREQGYFTVISADGERRYRINRGTHGNVSLVSPEGKTLVRYCVQPDAVPEGDAHAAQVLALQFNEPEFLRRANATRFQAA